MESGILADRNRHDAFVYFGRRISRQTLVERVQLWGYENTQSLNAVQESLVEVMCKNLCEQIFNATVANW